MIRIRPDGYPKRWPQPAASLTYFLNNAQVGRGNNLDIVGSGITSRPKPGGDGIIYDFSGITGGGSITIDTTPVIGGGVNEVLYTDPTGAVVTSDARFWRNKTTKEFSVTSDFFADPFEQTGVISSPALNGGGFAGTVVQYDHPIAGYRSNLFVGDATIALGFPNIALLNASDGTNSATFLAQVGPGSQFAAIQAMDASNDSLILVQDSLGIAFSYDSNAELYRFPRVDGINGQAFITNGAGAISWGNPTAAPAAPDTGVQYNNGGVLGASTDFTWDYTNRILTVGDVGGAANGAVMSLDDSAGSFGILTNTNDPVILADLSTIAVSFGDVNGTAGNNSKVTVDDNTKTTSFDGGMHISSSQATEPTTDLTGTTLNDGGGTGASATITAASTDVCGSITIVAGNGTPTAGLACSVVFDFAYFITPRSIMIGMKDADSLNNQPYVPTITTTGFEIWFGTALGASESVELWYQIIG